MQKNNIQYQTKENPKIKSKTLPLNHIIIDVSRDNELSTKTKTVYLAIFLLSHWEIKKEYGLDLKDLKRVLVSQGDQKIGFVFRFLDDNLEEKKVTLVSKKISKAQIENMIHCLPDSAFIATVNNEGILVDKAPPRRKIKFG